MKFILAILVLAFIAPANAEPLTFRKAFIKPEPLLCEFTAHKTNDAFPKDTVFLSACDFKAEWAKKSR